ncbi:MAG: TIGR02452 family protein [Polyangiaceae bacterium]
MKSSRRVSIALGTVEIAERGFYIARAGAPDERRVTIGPDVAACVEATRLVHRSELEAMKSEVLARAVSAEPTLLEITPETTLRALQRLTQSPANTPVCALNFASAKHPGGGFLKGASAQEESLARSSALYASLSSVPGFYAANRASPSLLYSESMIVSPNCPVFRDDDGALLTDPYLASFITSPAPNARAIRDRRSVELAVIPNTILGRSERVLAFAAATGHRRLVLGAWGCGVFGNDPRDVAGAFATHLAGPWRGVFEHVVFAIHDASPGAQTLAVFRELLAPVASR